MPVKKKPIVRYQILDELLADRYHNYSWDDLTNEVNRRLGKLGMEYVVSRTIEKEIFVDSNEKQLLEINYRFNNLKIRYYELQ